MPTTRYWSQAFFEDVQERAEAAAYEVAQSIGAKQQALIDSASKPDGTAQQPNEPGTVERKKRKWGDEREPLYNKGRLRDPRKWRVRRLKDGVVIRPPKDREAAVAVLATRGYVTVFDQLPDSVSTDLQRALDERLAGLEPQAD